jgi:hypothetical protein
VIDPLDLILGGIVAFAYFVGATTGFGAAIIVLTFAVHFFPITYLVPVVVPLNLLLSFYLSFRHYKNQDRRLLLRTILPMTCIGMPIGFAIFNWAHSENIKQAFGFFVLAIGLFEVVRFLRSKDDISMGLMTRTQTAFWLISGGIIQGMWVAGGPLVAYWAGRNIDNKATFRATLAGLWVLLNSILLVSHLATGTINLETAKGSAFLFPFVFIGLIAGEWMHEKLPEKAFRVVVYLILVFAGASILIRG